MEFRLAKKSDAKRLLEIYKPYVEKTAITFEYEVPTIAEFEKRIEKIGSRYPYIVAIENDKIIGYAYAGAYRERAAYDWVVELSIYLDENESDIFNCGYGYGYSVKEIIDSVKNTMKCDFKVIKGERREGDPSILVSDNTKIKEKMKWVPSYNNLELIIKSAYEWEKNLK